jgi:HlyD family type I secretion membrane fusion protein
MKGFLHRLKVRVEAAIRSFIRLEYLHAFLMYMTAKTPGEAGFEAKIEKELKSTIRPPIKFGLGVIAFGIGFFIIWGGAAPLDSASIAEGVIIVSGNHKTIQHLEGGVIEKITVKDGDHVKENDILLVINNSRPKAELAIVTSQLNFATAVQARLHAQLNNYDKIYWDNETFDFSDDRVDEIIKIQVKIFESQTAELKGQLTVLDERIAQKQEENIGHEKQLKSVVSQLNSLQEELKDTEILFKKGLALKEKVYRLRNLHDDSIGKEAQIKASIASNREVISETRVQKLNVQSKFQTELAKEIKENHSHLLEYTEKYNSIKDVLDRTVVKAPSSGIVTGLQYHTIGGVIQPGGKIMDIVPQDQKLIIEAKVKTQDIDSIHLGLSAKVQLGAYKSRLVPRIDGKVIYVSADKFTEQNPGQAQPPYYLARIEIDEAQIANMTLDVKLYPGMPVTVFIVKGERTFLQYMISPIRDSFFKAFKEV